MRLTRPMPARYRSFAAERYAVSAQTSEAVLADYVIAVMTGLSALAREGHGPDRLLATARLAGLALERALAG
jgi:TetR/AcrR family transcriptional repressor for divergent bdcA